MAHHVNAVDGRLEPPVEWPVTAADRLPAPRFCEGDLVLTPAGWVGEIVRIGWNGGREPSPFYGDDIWQAWIEDVRWVETHRSDWIPLHELVFLGESEAAREAARMEQERA